MKTGGLSSPCLILLKLILMTTRDIISIITISSSYLIVLLLLFFPIPVNNKDIINICIGVVLGGTLQGVTGFFFGNSKKDSSPTESTKITSDDSSTTVESRTEQLK